MACFYLKKRCSILQSQSFKIIIYCSEVKSLFKKILRTISKISCYGILFFYCIPEEQAGSKTRSPGLWLEMFGGVAGLFLTSASVSCGGRFPMIQN